MEYIHYFFDELELVVADGAWSESLLIGPQVWTHLSGEAREEFKLILGIDAADGMPMQTPASQIPAPRMQRDIVSAMKTAA